MKTLETMLVSQRKAAKSMASSFRGGKSKQALPGINSAATGAYGFGGPERHIDVRETAPLIQNEEKSY